MRGQLPLLPCSVRQGDDQDASRSMRGSLDTAASTRFCSFLSIARFPAGRTVTIAIMPSMGTTAGGAAERGRASSGHGNTNASAESEDRTSPTLHERRQAVLSDLLGQRRVARPRHTVSRRRGARSGWQIQRPHGQKYPDPDRSQNPDLATVESAECHAPPWGFIGHRSKSARVTPDPKETTLRARCPITREAA